MYVGDYYIWAACLPARESRHAHVSVGGREQRLPHRRDRVRVDRELQESGKGRLRRARTDHDRAHGRAVGRFDRDVRLDHVAPRVVLGDQSRGETGEAAVRLHGLVHVQKGEGFLERDGRLAGLVRRRPAEVAGHGAGAQQDRPGRQRGGSIVELGEALAKRLGERLGERPSAARSQALCSHEDLVLDVARPRLGRGIATQAAQLREAGFGFRIAAGEDLKSKQVVEKAGPIRVLIGRQYLSCEPGHRSGQGRGVGDFGAGQREALR